MEVQFTQLMSSLAETLRTVQNQQAQMQTMFMQQQQTTSNNTVSGIVLQPYDELHESFGSYIQRLNNYINLKGVTSPVTKLQIFLNCIGAKYYQVLKNINAPDTLENKTYEQLVEILKNHIAPEPGEVAQQHKFCLRIQNENESIANYVAGLKEIGGKCNFICNSCKSTTFDTHLRVQFIRGLRSSEIKERLLQESSQTSFDEIMRIAMAIETSKSKKGSCYRCGKSNHKANKCYLKNKLYCKKCNRKGHIQSVCFKSQKQITTIEDEEYSSQDEIYEIHKIENSEKDEKFKITLQLHSKERHTWELDTGAAVTTCSTEYYNKYFSDLKLVNSKIKLRTYTGEIINPIGICNIKIQYKNKKITGRLFVLNRKVDPVVGREWLRKLGVRLEINKIEIGENDITEEQYKKNLEKLIDQYREIFSEEIGEIRNYTVKFSLKENVTPIFIKARPVPFALKEKVENEIDRLEKAGILEKVTYSQWGTPVVPVVKQNGSVRLCADYRATLNKNLLDDKYPIPRVEEVFSKLSGGRYFCTLDINQAYLHMKTDPATAEMQAISTCKGTFKVNRLMFGVKVAPNQWQRYMDQTLQGLPGTACFFDDIAIQGQTYIELLKRIQTIFQKLKECGLHLNKNKCQFLKKSITYLGHKINENGLHPTEEKVNDIKNSPRPTDVSTLRTFLGMVNYYQQFIPNLASKLNPLYTLLQKNIKFIWSKECETSFQELKKEICSEKVLTPFHTHLPITLATDASPVGFGAVLSHIMPDNKERPIAFASRSLTSAEKGYSQLDKEAAALIWGLKKFFHYCYGRKITLIIDNQPLARILHPEKPMPTTTAVRLLHYANFLAGFDYNIKVRKSTEHANADYFSRLEHPTVKYNQLTDDDVFYLNQLTVLPVTFQKIKEATAKDLELQKLYQDIQSGTNYTKGLHEFSIQSNCIFYGIRIVIPKQLQPAILQELHTAHTGIVKMKALARSYVWWKNIDADIERMVNECKPCCLLQKNPTKIPIHSWEYPKEPWSRIHIDYAGPFFDQYFLIVVDAYTKWLEVIPTTSITTTTTIKILKNLFTTFGLPITIVSDNGRQFRSEEMMTFLKENGIQSKFTAPFHPSTNGQAERYVQTFKNKIKSMIHEKGTLMEKLSRFLMMYRKTPNNTTGLSPAEMMFKRFYYRECDTATARTSSYAGISEWCRATSCASPKYENQKTYKQIEPLSYNVGECYVRSERTSTRNVKMFCVPFDLAGAEPSGGIKGIAPPITDPIAVYLVYRNAD
ncbi:uncharacterized protein K02A2.6-like [Galleria mellonella]|uniref:RNA-directed DNA polymerase n=1 Tax=Galleria mellonella TaxID=7137 RepID=A0ABM3MJE2_GALME|nr:uncharacterized protein K02A2.6-like [Galleria mellonella]